MTDKPTGVFVRLPLSVADAATFKSKLNDTRVVSEALLAIGTPVTGGELPTAIFRVREHSEDNSNAWSYNKVPPSDQDASEYELEVERLLTHEQALALLAARDAEIARLRAALEEQKIYHESEDKSLSKQPPSSQGSWRRNQHQEQIELIDVALKGGAA